MAASADFTINGAVPAGVIVVTAESTVNLALVSVLGISSIEWSIGGASADSPGPGSNSPDDVAPVITPAGTPLGATASFTHPAEAIEGAGNAFIVKCRVVDHAGVSYVKTALVGINDETGYVPFAAGETNERHEDYFWTVTLNERLRNVGEGGGGGVSLSNSTPSQIDAADTGSAGVGTSAARSDHQHALNTAAVGDIADIGTSAAAGSALTVTRGGHVHRLTFAVVATVLGTASTAISVNNQNITNVADPVNNQDAATKIWVLNQVGGTSVIAGAGLTGGGALSSSVTLNVVAADGTIVVNADSIQVGTVPVANIALGAANQVLWSNGSVNSWTGAPILSTSLSIGSTVATAGHIRLPADGRISCRNAANNANLDVVQLSSDIFVFGGDTGVAGIQLRVGSGADILLRHNTVSTLTVGSSRITTASELPIRRAADSENTDVHLTPTITANPTVAASGGTGTVSLPLTAGRDYDITAKAWVRTSVAGGSGRLYKKVMYVSAYRTPAGVSALDGETITFEDGTDFTFEASLDVSNNVVFTLTNNSGTDRTGNILVGYSSNDTA